MVKPPPFWTVVVGAGTVALLGLGVIEVTDQDMLGWGLIWLAVLAVVIYVVWLLIWIWRHRGGGRQKFIPAQVLYRQSSA